MFFLMLVYLMMLFSWSLLCTHPLSFIWRREASKLKPGQREGRPPGRDPGPHLGSNKEHTGASQVHSPGGVDAEGGNVPEPWIHSDFHHWNSDGGLRVSLNSSHRQEIKQALELFFFPPKHKTPGTVNTNFFKRQRLLLRGTDSIHLFQSNANANDDAGKYLIPVFVRQPLVKGMNLYPI